MMSLSRSIVASSLGKCTAEVGTKIPEDDKEEFARFCRQNDTTPAEVLRDFILTKTRGVDFVRSLYERRIAVVSSSGSDRALGGGSHA